jgi:prevent-host-death family protein
MKRISITEARTHFNALVEQTATGSETLEITRRGSPAAVLVGVAEFDALRETIAVLSDPDLVKDIGQGLQDLSQGAVHTVEQVRHDMRPDSP